MVDTVKRRLELEEKQIEKTINWRCIKVKALLISNHLKDESEFLVLGGEPLNEPVFSYGPFVMNNEEQIRQCIQNYRTGKMGNPAVMNQ